MGKNNTGVKNHEVLSNGVSHEEHKHTHDWHFAKDYTTLKRGMFQEINTSKFACLCGAVKRVEQFEVEE